MKIINPLSPRRIKEDIKTVLRVLAGQGGCDGEPSGTSLSTDDGEPKLVDLLVSL